MSVRPLPPHPLPPRAPAAPPVRGAELSLSQARRIALRAQGLDRPRRALTGPATARHLQQVIDRLGLLQIDSVNVLARAHLMPVFSRIGPYDTGVLGRAAGRSPRRLVEAWAHEASFVPPETYRMLRWRHEGYRRRWLDAEDSFVNAHAAEIDEVRAMLRDRGPVTAREVQARFADRHPKAGRGWWDWSVAKEALERLFFMGEVTSAGRTTSFERRYDLVERVLPRHVLDAPEPTRAESMRHLVEHGARAHGIATERCIADYFRLRVDVTRSVVAELVEEGVLMPVRVRGWDRTVLWHREATLPRRAGGRALLSPFDPLVWERRRLLELFGMHYRIEIYTPAPKRVHGYYVLPFLLGEALAARVDLKADRRGGVLRVESAFAEQGTGLRPVEVAVELSEELAEMARWLGLGEVAVAPGARGDLAGLLPARRAAG